MRGRVWVPLAAEVTAHTEEGFDDDGLTVQHLQAKIRVGAVDMTLSTLAGPPTAADATATLPKPDSRFPVHLSRLVAPGHWATATRWRPGECTVSGYAHPAGLRCRVFKCPCTDARMWLDVCASIAAAGAANAPITGPAIAFPSLEDPAEAALAFTVSLAIARDDRERFISTVGPAGLKIGNRNYNEAKLRRLLRNKALGKVLFNYCAAYEDLACQYSWNLGFDDDGGRIFFFADGYGEQPYFRLAKAGPRWVLRAVAEYDFGEP